jgi:hypothetical protein
MKNAIDLDYREYQETMQTAALAFLERHQCEHLGSDQLLFSRAVQHLAGCLEVPWQIAEKLVNRAYGELKSNNDRHQLDIKASSSNVAVITDPASGQTWAVPISMIYQRILNAPDNCRLRLVRP